MTGHGQGPIYFYNRDEDYYEFTNFYEKSPFNLDDCHWLTSEHYFQAQKFVGTPYFHLIRDAPRPRDAFNLSRDPLISHWRRNDWEDIKVDIMKKALNAKFTQNDDLKDLLLRTGDRELVEHSPYDSFWGDGRDGTGDNWLGKLLMELRSRLKLSVQSQLQPEDERHSTDSSIHIQDDADSQATDMDTS